MAVDRPNDASERFIVARFAFWAGDFALADSLFEQIVSAYHAEQPGALQESPATVVLARVAQDYLEAMREAEKRKRGRAKSPQPEPLITASLRGIVRPRGLAAFEMRAFLTDLTWERSLCGHFARLSEFKKNSGNESPKATPWIAQQNPVVVVHVGSLGLITAFGNWCRVPEDGDEVREVFLRVLTRLEAGK